MRWHRARILRPLAALVFLLLAASGLSAQAAPLADEEADQVRQVFVAQLSALALDDADSAFATATPAVQAAVGSAGRFLAMVRGAYPMVVRPAAVTFHKPDRDEDDGEVVQLVEIRDQAGQSWLAVFALERQPDASWRISGCAVAENRWLAT